MVRRDHTFAVALLLSVAVHAGIYIMLAGWAGVTRPLAQGAGPAGRDAGVALASPSPAAFDFVFGDAHGYGDGSHARAGDDPMISRQGTQQAFLSRDPVGAGRVGDEPSMSVLPRAAASAAVPAPQPPPAAPPPPVLGMASAVRSAPRVTRTPPAQSPPGPTAPTAAPAPQPPAATPTGPAESERSDTPPADPAIMSDSESDPFSRTSAGVTFRDGRVDVRFGRKVKTVRPRLSLAAQYDLFSMQFPRMVVRLSVGPSGGVRRVEIVKSTGSATADQDVKVALYQWWVEPAKGPTGVAVADTIEFPITWR